MDDTAMTDRDLIQIHENAAFQTNNMRFEHAGFVCLCVLVGFALFGGLGSGPLADATIALGPASLEYPRICREGRSTTFTFSVPQGTTKLFIGAGVLKGFRVEAISPAPDSQSMADDGVWYHYDTPLATSSEILFHVHPATVGILHGKATVDQANAQELTVYMLP